jgi:hypothetical protein
MGKEGRKRRQAAGRRADADDKPLLRWCIRLVLRRRRFVWLGRLGHVVWMTHSDTWRAPARAAVSALALTLRGSGTTASGAAGFDTRRTAMISAR